MNSNLLLQAANKNRSDTKFSEKNFTRHYNRGDLIVENGKLKICTVARTKDSAKFETISAGNPAARASTFIEKLKQGDAIIVSGESIYNVRED